MKSVFVAACLTCITSIVVAHFATPLQYSAIVSNELTTKTNTVTKIFAWITVILNTIQALLYYLGLLYAAYLFFWLETRGGDLIMQKNFNTRWIRSKRNQLKRLQSLLGTTEGCRYLQITFLPSLGYFLQAKAYSEPIVMAYIFSICTWTIPL